MRKLKKKTTKLYYVSVGEKERIYTLRRIGATTDTRATHNHDFILTWNEHVETLSGDIDVAHE